MIIPIRCSNQRSRFGLVKTSVFKPNRWYIFCYDGLDSTAAITGGLYPYNGTADACLKHLVLNLAFRVLIPD